MQNPHLFSHDNLLSLQNLLAEGWLTSAKTRLFNHVNLLSLQVPSVWNSLPPHIRNVATIITLKSTQKTHFFRQYHSNPALFNLMAAWRVCVCVWLSAHDWFFYKYINQLSCLPLCSLSSTQDWTIYVLEMVIMNTIFIIRTNSHLTFNLKQEFWGILSGVFSNSPVAITTGHGYLRWHEHIILNGSSSIQFQTSYKVSNRKPVSCTLKLKVKAHSLLP